MDDVRDAPDGLRDEATAWIRDLILSGELRGGEYISENLLKERFIKEKSISLSRTPIRQALTTLAAEGLVETVARSGTRVRLVHSDDAVNIMVLRYAIETVVVCKLAHDHAQVDFAEVDVLTKTMDQYAKLKRLLTAEERTAFVHADIEFHTKLAKLADCIPAIDTLRTFSGQFLIVAAASIRAQDARRDVVNEHKDVLKAIRSGDEDAARDAMHRHLYSTLDRWSPYATEYLRDVVPRYFGLKDSPSSKRSNVGSRRKVQRIVHP